MFETQDELDQQQTDDFYRSELSKAIANEYNLYRLPTESEEYRLRNTLLPKRLQEAIMRVWPREEFTPVNIHDYKYEVDYDLDREGKLVVRFEVDKGISRVDQLIRRNK